MKRMILLMGLGLVSSLALAGEAKLSWTPPTQCTDNSPITNCPLTGFEIEKSTDYNATTGAGTWAPVSTVSQAVVSYTVPNLGPGTYAFRVRAACCSSDPKQSGYSNVGTKTIEQPVPKPPTLTVADSGEPAYKLDLTAQNTARWSLVGKAKAGSACKADYKIDIKGETKYMLASRFSIYNAISYPNQVWASCNG